MTVCRDNCLKKIIVQPLLLMLPHNIEIWCNIHVFQNDSVSGKIMAPQRSKRLNILAFPFYFWSFWLHSCYVTGEEALVMKLQNGG